MDSAKKSLCVALAMAACACHARDASTDSGGPDGCPLREPRNGENCDFGSVVGRSCAYSSDLCRCLSTGQDSAQWTCDRPLGGADPRDGSVPVGDGGLGTAACLYHDGGVDAAARFHGSCDGGCPPGTICAVEIGGVAGGGGAYCAPIVDRCRNDLSCDCLASCVCGESYGRAERCSTSNGDGVERIECDNGIR
jgi:hypothetical protein